MSVAHTGSSLRPHGEAGGPHAGKDMQTQRTQPTATRAPQLGPLPKGSGEIALQWGWGTRSPQSDPHGRGCRVVPGASATSVKGARPACCSSHVRIPCVPPSGPPIGSRDHPRSVGMGVLGGGGCPFHPMTKCAIYLQKPDTHHLWSSELEMESECGSGASGDGSVGPCAWAPAAGPSSLWPGSPCREVGADVGSAGCSGARDLGWGCCLLLSRGGRGISRQNLQNQGRWERVAAAARPHL